MAIAVDEHSVVKVVDNVLSMRVRSVRNAGPDSCTVSRAPDVTAADGFVLALNDVQPVTLVPGEALYAITAAGETASLDVL